MFNSNALTASSSMPFLSSSVSSTLFIRLRYSCLNRVGLDTPGKAKKDRPSLPFSPMDFWAIRPRTCPPDRDNDLLSPVPAVEVLQVFRDGVQSGQFSGEMDGEASPMSGGSQRADKRSYKDLKIDVEEMEEPYLDFEESSNKKLHEVIVELSLNFLKQSPLASSLLIQSVCQETAGKKEEKRISKLLHSCCTAEGSVDHASPISLLEYWVYPDNQHHRALCPVSRTIAPVTHRPRPVISALSPVTAIAPKVSSVVNPMVSSPVTDTCSPSSSMCSPTSSAWDSLRSTSRSPGCSDQDPVSAAAHLHLLGESLSLIGLHLQETNKLVSMSSSLSLLLDSLLCALAPLICLSAQIPELRSCTQHTLASTLENIAYLMPGL
ncbi:hypothetical protein F7725_005591 [Dissostichus mawsoni]|uniref:Uncharacterized protein n=1 Tax=Dissostichus mawsoni TaxID=36200 RepID=A0A7J5YRV5_DISMA|nr:hypothetical protein F7725_005591 [Dissostichus mawsoni]